MGSIAEFDTLGQAAWNIVAYVALALAFVDGVNLWRADTKLTHPLEIAFLVWFSLGVDGWFVPVGAFLYLGVYRWVTPARKARA